MWAVRGSQTSFFPIIINQNADGFDNVIALNGSSSHGDTCVFFLSDFYRHHCKLLRSSAIFGLKGKLFLENKKFQIIIGI